MAASDDFRKQLKAGNLKEALALALSKAVELKITTWVASGSDDLEETNAKPGHRLRTHIKSIEGKIENEIGDQFIGNGPYRELQQFHTEQVAESNKIIQSNLQSLQKLFETLINLRSQAATPPAVEPESLDDESQLLPPAEPGTEDFSRQTPIEQEEAFDTEDEDDNWDDSVLDLLESLPVVPPPTQESLTSQLNEDWQDFMGEAPESGATQLNSSGNQNWETLRREDFEPPQTSPESYIETAGSQFEENWRDFIGAAPERLPSAADLLLEGDEQTFTRENSQSPSPSLETDIETSHPPTDEDRRDLGREDVEDSLTPPGLSVNPVWETLAQEDSESPPTSPEADIEASRSQRDEDWGWEDLGAAQLEPEAAVPESPVPQDRVTIAPDDFEPPFSPAPNLEVSASELEDEDWGDFLTEEPESQPAAVELSVEPDRETLTPQQLESQPSTASTIETSQTQIDDDDWGDLVEDEPEPDLDKPIPSLDALQLDEDEEWDDWVVEESESLQDTPVVDMELLDLGEERDWDDFEDDSNPFITEASSSESASYLETVGIGEGWNELTTGERQPNSAAPDAGTIGASGETSLPMQSQQEPDKGVVSRESDSVVKSEDDLDVKSQPVEKRVPPPPPPSRFPNQNTEK
jgi:hypothetical protein